MCLGLVAEGVQAASLATQGGGHCVMLALVGHVFRANVVRMTHWA